MEYKLFPGQAGAPRLVVSCELVESRSIIL